MLQLRRHELCLESCSCNLGSFSFPLLPGAIGIQGTIQTFLVITYQQTLHGLKVQAGLLPSLQQEVPLKVLARAHIYLVGGHMHGECCRTQSR